MNDRESAISDELAEKLFRHSYAKMVAVLVRYFGLAAVDIAEDIVQDTLVEALEKWSVTSMPHNPEGWLMDVAKKKTINQLRRNQILRRKVLPDLRATLPDQQLAFDEKTIRDSSLRMIFAACHPSLAAETQIVLALRSLCGLSIAEIADALLTSKATINKRLHRAKQKFRTGEIAFEIPDPRELDERLDAVFLTLYLLFNEGYYSPHSNQLIRADLCLEAVRLQTQAVTAFPQSAKAKALLALMLLCFARFESRLDEGGALVVLQKQDRSLWDKALIGAGLDYLHQSIQGSAVNTFQLQAGIMAEHCLAEEFATTNWPSIYRQYCLLEKLDGNLLIKMNKIIASFYVGLQREAVAELEQLQTQLPASQQALCQATLALFFEELGQVDNALTHYQLALAKARSEREQLIIQQRIDISRSQS